MMIPLEDFSGKSLKKLSKRSATVSCPMPLNEFLNLAIQITEVLGKINAANVIHKDIRLSNIVLNGETKIVKIIDFGISTRLARTNPTFKNANVLEDTLAYMPLQTGRMNRFLNYRTNFYSLNVTFYELLTGQLPFTTTDVLKLVYCHIAKQYLTKAIELLALNSWELNYNISLVLYEAATEAEYLCGDFDEMEEWASVVIQQAINEQEAIAIWQQWKPHLIFIDTQITVMNDIEVTQHTKATPPSQVTAVDTTISPCAIVAVSASSLESERAVFLQAGGDGLISKPFREAEIFDTLHNQIGVCFIYDETAIIPVSIGTEINVLTPVAIASLPPDLVAHLHQAILNLNLKLMHTFIAQIRELNEYLADAISVLSKRFQYEQLFS